MSVTMTARIKGDPRRLEEYAAGNPDAMRSIADRAEEHGLIAHRFYGSDDGQIMVLDEWPDQRSFQSFYADQQDRIQPLFEAAGVTSEPEFVFWHQLETKDDVGWAR